MLRVIFVAHHLKPGTAADTITRSTSVLLLFFSFWSPPRGRSTHFLFPAHAQLVTQKIRG